MGQHPSKGELLYHQVSYRDSQGVISLHQQGASLEWIDKEGKTPLILSSLNSDMYDVAKTLIELGANVNAYRPGRNGGTPLHHAAKRGIDNIVNLLLSNGANPLVMNDDCQTPLEVARAKGFTNVVRTIENHICLFSGWMRDIYGPAFLEVLAPWFASRKVWVVVSPTGSRNASKAYKLELAIYSGIQDAKPRTLIALWKANLEDSKLHHSDPSLQIVDITNISRGRGRRRARRRSGTVSQTRIKLASGNEGDKQQLQRFCDACKGIPQAIHRPAFIQNSPARISQPTAPPYAEDLELAIAINASIQTAILKTRVLESAPSAPPMVDQGQIIQDDPIHYLPIDFSPVDISSQPVEKLASSTSERKGGSWSSCVICFDAAIEGACIPCGHMAGCMSCLKEIRAKKWGCPACRAKIDQVVRLFAV